MEPSDFKKDFAGKIKEVRLKSGLTQEQFGQRVGIHKQQISRYERGVAFPRDDQIKKIIEYGASDTNFSCVLEPKEEYEVVPSIADRRLPENGPKRKLINKILKLLDSGNKTIVTALESNVEAFLLGIEPQKGEAMDGD